MKKLIITMLLINTGCGVWYAEWQGDIRKADLKAKGEAELLEAESSKKIAVESAKAQLESAKLLSQAEVERAKGAAEANRIIGNSLKNNDSYLKYLYITNLEKGGTANTVYVPTEAGLPLFLESKK
jgi:regulator of protease activity HflC (stomatin/prohibitin superfamily)